MDLKSFIADQITHMPAEATTVRKVYKALKDNGTPVVRVFDGEEFVEVSNLQETLETVFNLDYSRLYTEDGSWVLLVLGNGWDTLTDYTTDLEDALKPVNDYLMTKD